MVPAVILRLLIFLVSVVVPIHLGLHAAILRDLSGKPSYDGSPNCPGLRNFIFYGALWSFLRLVFCVVDPVMLAISNWDRMPFSFYYELKLAFFVFLVVPRYQVLNRIVDYAEELYRIHVAPLVSDLWTKSAASREVLVQRLDSMRLESPMVDTQRDAIGQILAQKLDETAKALGVDKITNNTKAVPQDVKSTHDIRVPETPRLPETPVMSTPLDVPSPRILQSQVLDSAHVPVEITGESVLPPEE